MTRNEELAPRHLSAQLSLFPSTREQFIAEMFVSADEMGLWHRKGWLSFDPLTVDRYDEQERVEVLFIKGLTCSGLSDAMIIRILSSLKKPFCYDPSTTFFSFAENRWISLPPERDQVDVTNEYLNDRIDAEDWDALRIMQNKISQALKDPEDTNE